MSDRVPLLVATAIHKSYSLGKRRLEVLRGVDLTVRPGEFVALRGASGAGKSTLLHLAGGLDRPDSGTLVVGGVDLATLSQTGLTTFRNRRIGFIFQAYHLLPELDAVENVCLPGRMARRPAAEVREQARELLSRVGLGDRLEHRPYELSGGEQQRVSLARCLINNPELILADEPTGNLDTRTGMEVLELLLSLGPERGTTLVVATHDAKVAERAGRVVQLEDGKVVGGGEVNR
jgi:ABC-type lipoprotein export system ATPase subunit